jgi:hypothetical protein
MMQLDVTTGTFSSAMVKILYYPPGKEIGGARQKEDEVASYYERNKRLAG